MRSPIARALFALALLFLTLPATAQIKVAFPGPGTWEAWIGPGAPGGKATFKSQGQTIELPIAGTENTDRVSAYNAETGNLAHRELGDIDDVWKVKSTDFIEVAEVDVEVTHNGKPVAAANVSLKSKERTQTLLLTPSQRGRLTFRNVRAGTIEVTISTSKDGKEVLIPKQLFELALVRQQKVPLFRIAVAEAVDTVIEGAAKSEPAGKAPSSQGASPLFKVLQMLIGLGAIGALAYLAWRYLPGVKPKIDEQLAKIGVQIPEDAQPDDPPTPPTPAPIPIEQIILSQSAPAPATAPTPALSGPAGRFDIPEGVTLVTREEGLGMMLESSTVSRKHAELVRDGASVTLRDLGSTNGTFVNGEKVTSPVELRSGDRVQFGDVQLVVEGL